ncbi:hypothetical protein [Paenibacillus thermotolerans]|uniref:hypothetical protein n=1 Tax=Paenibacillus thermotolerans TaxID=3027807 RepID=UPI002368CB3B|nr:MULTISPECIES: hypothetical protein [unclassified Paenibacillus]
MADEKKQRFETIETEQINIVDKNGNVRMSLFNSERMPEIVMEGQPVSGKRSGIPGSGIMFYNNEGDECGGLVFGSAKDDNGNYVSFGSVTFDAYKDDQVIQTNFWETNGLRNYGFILYDRPSGKERLYMGRGQNGDYAVTLCDSKGTERIRMVIDSNDVPRMEFLNENGEVVYKLPPE